MVFAYNELTQYVSVSNGCLVADGVNDGFAAVAVSVGVGEGASVMVAVNVNVGISVGSGVGVIVAGVTGFGREVNIKAISRTIPMMMGTTYLRSAGGINPFALSYGVTVGGSPLYPSADNRLLKLSAYSPLKKLT